MAKVMIDMEMPESCYDCRFVFDKFDGNKHKPCCAAFYGKDLVEACKSKPFEYRADFCPLKEIKECKK